MVRESVDDDRLIAGRPDKRAVQTETESEFEAVEAEDKPRVLTEMQRHVEAGEDEEEALEHAIHDVEEDRPHVRRADRESRAEGRPEGETTPP